MILQTTAQHQVPPAILPHLCCNHKPDRKPLNIAPGPPLLNERQKSQNPTRRFQRPRKGNQDNACFAQRSSHPNVTVNCAASQSTVLTTHNHELTIIYDNLIARPGRTASEPLSLALTTLPRPRRFTVSRTLNRCKLRQICMRRTTTFRSSPVRFW